MAHEPFDKFSDPFRPPLAPCEVHCLHCHRQYESWQIEWRDLPDTPIGGTWCCPTPGCDGVGFGFDIVPVDPEWTDEHGEKIYHQHLDAEFDDADDDEDEGEEDEDDGPFFDFSALDEDEEELTLDVFDEHAFWVDHGITRPKAHGNTPQPPFDFTPPPKSYKPLDDDDIPF